jgi:hypothetical protein
MALRGIAGLFIVLTTAGAFAADIANFEDLSLDPNSYRDGSDGSGGFVSGGAFFNNNYIFDWHYCDGFAYSNIIDTTTSGTAGLYNCIAGTGQSDSNNYAVGYVGWDTLPTVIFNDAQIQGLYVTNTNYAYYSMLNGDTFAKKFGGDDGNDPDWFLLTITGRDVCDAETGSVEFYLADFRFEDSNEDYILDTWEYVDLNSLGMVDKLEFSLSSSDTGDWGMNTPACFALDTIVLGRYAPAAGEADSTAVHMDDAGVIGWADGWENYVVGSNCDAQWQTPEKALGKANGTSYDIVCLGRGGSITLTFDCGIGDGPGYDFAVFENSITDTFLELAYVEVSSDGVNFFRFLNDSLTEGPVGGYGSVNAVDIGGFAGKYKQGYGTPFDLALLTNTSGLLDIDNVKWVRIVDIVGDGSYSDTSGDIIYDPYPTWGSAGFDLDAIGVLNMRTADFDLSGNVDYADLFILVQAWLGQPGDGNWDGRCDISHPADGIINLLDFTIFASQWLEGEQH